MSLKAALEKIELKGRRYHKWMKRARNKFIRLQKEKPILKYRRGWEL